MNYNKFNNIRIIINPNGNGTKDVGSPIISELCPFKFYNVFDLESQTSLKHLDLDHIKHLIEAFYNSKIDLSGITNVTDYTTRILYEVGRLEYKYPYYDKFIYILPRDNEELYRFFIDMDIIKFEYKRKRTTLYNTQLVYV